jgi:hypothetical protein
MDMGSESYEFTANVWNWKAALGIIKSLDIVGDGKVRQMGVNATGVKVDIDDAHAIGATIRDKILPKMSEKGRMMADLSITETPDDMTLHRETQEQWKNYSVSYEWLKDFSDFCLKSKGFQIF